MSDAGFCEFNAREDLNLFSKALEVSSNKILHFTREDREQYLSYIITRAKKHSVYPQALQEFISTLNENVTPDGLASLLEESLVTFLKCRKNADSLVELLGIVSARFNREYESVEYTPSATWYLCMNANKDLDGEISRARKQNTCLQKKNTELNRRAKEREMATNAAFSGRDEGSGSKTKRRVRKRNPNLKKSKVPAADSDDTIKLKLIMFENILSVTRSIFCINEEKAHFFHALCAVDAVFNIADKKRRMGEDVDTNKEANELYLRYLFELTSYRDAMTINAMYGFLRNRSGDRAQKLLFAQVHKEAWEDFRATDEYLCRKRSRKKKSTTKEAPQSNSSRKVTHENGTSSALTSTYRNCLNLIKKFRMLQNVVRKTNSFLYNNSELEGASHPEPRETNVPLVLGCFKIQITEGERTKPEHYATNSLSRAEHDLNSSEVKVETSPDRKAVRHHGHSSVRSLQRLQYGSCENNEERHEHRHDSNPPTVREEDEENDEDEEEHGNAVARSPSGALSSYQSPRSESSTSHEERRNSVEENVTVRSVPVAGLANRGIPAVDNRYSQRHSNHAPPQPASQKSTGMQNGLLQNTGNPDSIIADIYPAFKDILSVMRPEDFTIGFLLRLRQAAEHRSALSNGQVGQIPLLPVAPQADSTPLPSRQRSQVNARASSSRQIPEHIADPSFAANGVLPEQPEQGHQASSQNALPQQGQLALAPGDLPYVPIPPDLIQNPQAAALGAITGAESSTQDFARHAFGQTRSVPTGDLQAARENAQTGRARNELVGAVHAQAGSSSQHYHQGQQRRAAQQHVFQWATPLQQLGNPPQTPAASVENLEGEVEGDSSRALRHYGTHANADGALPQRVYQNVAPAQPTVRHVHPGSMAGLQERTRVAGMSTGNDETQKWETYRAESLQDFEEVERTLQEEQDEGGPSQAGAMGQVDNPEERGEPEAPAAFPEVNQGNETGETEQNGRASDGSQHSAFEGFWDEAADVEQAGYQLAGEFDVDHFLDLG